LRIITTPDSADRLATILEKVRAIGPTLRERAPEAERAADDIVFEKDVAVTLRDGVVGRRWQSYECTTL